MVYDVILAGAGPVGLFLAGELRLAKLSVLVLEKLEDPHSILKQLPFGMRGLWGPSVEAFYRRGLLEAVASLNAADPRAQGLPIQQNTAIRYDRSKARRKRQVISRAFNSTTATSIRRGGRTDCRESRRCKGGGSFKRARSSLQNANLCAFREIRSRSRTNLSTSKAHVRQCHAA